MAKELLLFEVETAADGKQAVKRIMRECSVAKASRLLQVSRKQIQRLYYAGILKGWKPGLALARARGMDGKTCKIVLCWESVMEFREVEQAAQRAMRGN
tara:strand:+ start:4401 stop:4697 length:297 start_codon:yes stop_codon:yes gene_type:complete